MNLLLPQGACLPCSRAGGGQPGHGPARGPEEGGARAAGAGDLRGLHPARREGPRRRSGGIHVPRRGVFVEVLLISRTHGVGLVGMGYLLM